MMQTCRLMCALASLFLLAPKVLLAAPEADRTSCRISGISSEVFCGSVARALDPANPRVTIDVHYVVIPARARNKKQDALFFFAGGPGQSAIKVAPQVSAMFSRFTNFRDIVLIDQRGTGKSANLECKRDERMMSLDEMLAMNRNPSRMRECKDEIEKRPHGMLAFYTTTLAMQDADAVRAKLGYEKINIAGVSYGTRAVLEYARLFPQRVRRALIDGVAPPDMVLPASASADNQAALDALIKSCELNAGCAKSYPNLRRDWRALMDAPSRSVKALNPMTGREDTVTLDRVALTGLVRGPLYVPAIAAGLPHAISEAAAGRWTPILGLATMMGGATSGMSWGMHFSVLCSEDHPRIAQSKEVAGIDFGEHFAAMYRAVCADWPKAVIDPAYYTVPSAQFPVLVLSGGADPVTPPRHGEHVAQKLGANAQHVVVPEAGHGVIGIGCMTDLVFKFFDVKTDAEAMKLDAKCVTEIPRPTVWRPVMPGAAK